MRMRLRVNQTCLFILTSLLFLAGCFFYSTVRPHQFLRTMSMVSITDSMKESMQRVGYEVEKVAQDERAAQITGRRTSNGKTYYLTAWVPEDRRGIFAESYNWKDVGLFLDTFQEVAAPSAPPEQRKFDLMGTPYAPKPFTVKAEADRHDVSQPMATATSLIPPAVVGESDVLNLESAKGVLKPRDDAYALVVGISNYKALSGPRFANHDARQVQRMLCNLAGFQNDPFHIRVRVDQEATIGTLYGDLHWLLQKARLNPEAAVFFYFSGHGSPLLGEDGASLQDGLLVPYETNLDALNDRTAVSLSFLRSELGKLKNKDVVCVIDACFSGSGKSVSRLKAIKPKMKRDLLASEKLFISAAAADRPAEEYAPGEQGAFTYFFLKALMGHGDTNNDGWVDTLEAYNYAREKLDALGLAQNPQMNRQQSLKLTKLR